jgi:8-oxo-dGTP pyrophosphatase MutT (NUDIX family)
MPSRHTDRPPAWLAAARARADQPPATPREPLRVCAAVCGSVEPGLARQLVQAGLPLRREDAGWILAGDALDDVARWLHAHGHGGRWRDEPLAVRDAAGTVLAQVERAAVRALGIATRAVHLVGTTASGEVWVQQRALDKAVDPGLLDTLVGGLVAGDETDLQSLEREAWEEAGLQLTALERLTPLAGMTVRRPVSDGYMVEHIEAFQAVVPEGRVPANQDGEVMAFECLRVPELLAALATGRFTLEAVLIHGRWIESGRHRA